MVSTELKRMNFTLLHCLCLALNLHVIFCFFNSLLLICMDMVIKLFVTICLFVLY